MSVPHTLSSFLQLPQHVATVQLKLVPETEYAQ